MLQITSCVPLSIDVSEVHLWCIEYADCSTQEILDEYMGILSPGERSRAKTFHRENDRLCYILSRILMKTVLAKYVGISTEDVKFKYNSFGKPELADEILNQETKIDFNLSHTDALIILAVRSGGQVGVDVENPLLRRAPLELANEIFSLEEMEEFQGLPQRMKGQRFFQHWTLKESYIKARGLGLSIPLHFFGFSFDGNRIQLHLKSELDDNASNWIFWQLEVCDRYLVAVCSRKENFAQNLFLYGLTSPMRQGLMPHRVVLTS